MVDSNLKSRDVAEKSPSSDHPGWWNPLHWRLVIWVSLFVCIAAAIPFGIRWYLLSHVPIVAEPFDMTAFVVEPLAEDQNAFTEYRMAIAVLKSSRMPQPPNLHKSEETDWDPLNTGMHSWLEEHQDALAVWRRGTEKDRGLANDLTHPELTSSVDDFYELHVLGQTALAEQARSLHEDHVEEARLLARAVFRCGGHLTWRSTMLNGLLGMTLHEMSFLAIRRWAEHPSVTTEQLRRALNEVRSDFKLYDAESSMMKLEFIAFRNALGRRSRLLDFADAGPVGPQGNLPMRLGRAGMLWLSGEPDLTVRLLAQVTVNQVREVDQSVKERRPLVSSMPTILFDTEGHTDRVDGELTGAQINNVLKLSSVAGPIAFSRSLFDRCHLALRARQSVLETMLVLQIYCRDKDRFPERLDELVPEFLDVVPVDPCHRDALQLVYGRNSQQQLVLYSVGSNCQDDGGVVGSNDRSSDIGYVLKEVP